MEFDFFRIRGGVFFFLFTRKGFLIQNRSLSSEILNSPSLFWCMHIAFLLIAPYPAPQSSQSREREMAASSGTRNQTMTVDNKLACHFMTLTGPMKKVAIGSDRTKCPVMAWKWMVVHPHKHLWRRRKTASVTAVPSGPGIDAETFSPH